MLMRCWGWAGELRGREEQGNYTNICLGYGEAAQTGHDTEGPLDVCLSDEQTKIVIEN